MNENIQSSIQKVKEFWSKRTKVQKMVALGSLALLIVVLAITVMVSSNVKFVPLYSNLSAQETGQIKATLDQRGVKSEIQDNGSTILVPEQMVDTLKVDLAAEGIPESGTIDYSYFGKSSGFGMTDNEFNMLKLEATQTEIAKLLKGIEGVKDAKVMITLPEKSIWVNANDEPASASIVLNTSPGYTFKQEQIKSLYHLVSKSIPNLPTDNIVMMNQNFEYFDLENEENNSTVNAVENQLSIKREVERDIQRQVQQLLGTMMGQEKVVVSVTADIDFKQENREENLVEPVDKEKMAGLAVSVERITETYSNGTKKPGGVPGTGETDLPNYSTETSTDSNGDYEKIEERINNEVNKIHKQIVESPYKIRDLGIQVMVEPPNPEDKKSMPKNTVTDIQNILGTVVRTSIAKDTGTPLTDQDVQSKVYVSVQPFKGKVNFNEGSAFGIPTWVYVVAVILFVVIAAMLFFLFIRKRKEETYTVEELASTTISDFVPEIEDADPSATTRRKQLEKMAQDKPEDFAKLLRTWISED